MEYVASNWELSSRFFSDLLRLHWHSAALLLTSDKAQSGGIATWTYLLATLAFFVAVIVGGVATITRLLDFRYTAKKLRLQDIGGDEAEIDLLEERANHLGERTWRLLWYQIGGFVFGVAMLLCALWQMFHQRLFP